tara:strand:+ start:265 stop:510 length:246 start_codon:yes stop_codon:yes gene_type:complete
MSNVTQEELNEVKTIAESEQRTASQLGFVEAELHSLTINKESLLTNLAQLRNLRQTKLKELTDKYGAGTLNIDTGEFTSTK